MEAESPPRSLLGDCFAGASAWVVWCATCGLREPRYQAFSDERTEALAASGSAPSPYQSPVQQASASGHSGGERASLLPKATELHATNTGAGRQGAGLKPPKWSKEEQAPAPSKELKQVLSGKTKSSASLAASEEEELCPTCLEPYTPDNPAIWTKCNHAFHLACIYEWLERKQTCPLCERVMSFDEVLE